MEATYKYFGSLDFPLRKDIWDRIDQTSEARNDKRFIYFAIQAVVSQIFIIICCVRNLFDTTRNWSARWKVEKFLITIAVSFLLYTVAAILNPKVVELTAETLRGIKFLNDPIGQREENITGQPVGTEESDREIQAAIEASFKK